MQGVFRETLEPRNFLPIAINIFNLLTPISIGVIITPFDADFM
jgi:hypothetical protein